jgi:hypothetical protein
MVARLTHARLYGTDDPCVDRTPEDIMMELNQIRSHYRHQDNHFLFHDRAQKVQFVVYNQGEEPIIVASASAMHCTARIFVRLPRGSSS